MTGLELIALGERDPLRAAYQAGRVAGGVGTFR